MHKWSEIKITMNVFCLNGSQMDFISMFVHIEIFFSFYWKGITQSNIMNRNLNLNSDGQQFHRYLQTNKSLNTHTHTHTLEPHMELHPLAWDWWNSYVMELTKTLVINVVPTSYNSKCREKKTLVYHWFVSLIWSFIFGSLTFSL